MKMKKKKLFAKRRYTRSRGGDIAVLTFLILFGLFSIIPMVYSVITSFKPLDELLLYPPKFMVSRPTLENYLNLPQLLSNLKVPLSRYIFNSFLITVVGTALHILIATGAGFVLSKTNFRWNKLILRMVQVALLYSAATLEVPRYLIYSKLGMIDTYAVYILPYLPSAMGVFLIKQYMDVSLPKELIEAANIDGAGNLRIFFQLALPMVKPAWLTVFLFAFRDLWSTTAIGTIFSENLKTLGDAVSTISTAGIARSGSAMAVTVLMMIPPIIVYLFSQNSVTETMSTSGIK